ncbi:uncharacterized protein LOC142818803 isoform X4 [Pelodiscus sinensis]|uniref:uncharacterized protein LOC142818803 isoform X4 n=1 Tax=Pelodiscus sinensis TaxID=13735 RepID=UPI003F6D34E3
MESGGISFLLGLLALWATLPPARVQEQPGKGGDCPAGRVEFVRPSRIYCLSDRSCPGSEKCCNSGHMRTCLLPDTVSPGYCPERGAGAGEPCRASCNNDSACASGAKCCARGCRVLCVGAVPAKPGVCPKRRVSQDFTPCANQCEDDRQCPGRQKCCFAACGLACLSPYTEKAGVCPDLPRELPQGLCVDACVDACVDDADCPGEQKCCATGCGYKCRGPLAVKPGACPAVLRGSLGPCVERCRSDGDCGRTEKCCRTGCGRVCKPPVEEKPGRCRRPLFVCTGAVTAECDTDAECPGSHKCCPVGCARTCRPPETAPRGSDSRLPARGQEKPGYCPALVPPGLSLSQSCGPCLANRSCSACAGDTDCPGPEKCCPSQCGTRCTEPIANFCHLGPDVGPCKAWVPRLFYNASARLCELFIYGGCRGNTNNFAAEEECLQACGPHGLA